MLKSSVFRSFKEILTFCQFHFRQELLFGMIYHLIPLVEFSANLSQIPQFRPIGVSNAPMYRKAFHGAFFVPL